MLGPDRGGSGRRRARAGGHDSAVRRTDQGPAHCEAELRPADRQDESALSSWRPIRRVEPDGTMRPLTFASLGAAQAHAKRMSRQETRIVAVERDGWRRVVDDGGA